MKWQTFVTVGRSIYGYVCYWGAFLYKLGGELHFRVNDTDSNPNG